MNNYFFRGKRKQDQGEKANGFFYLLGGLQDDSLNEIDFDLGGETKKNNSNYKKKNGLNKETHMVWGKYEY